MNVYNYFIHSNYQSKLYVFHHINKLHCEQGNKTRVLEFSLKYDYDLDINFRYFYTRDSNDSGNYQWTMKYCKK